VRDGASTHCFTVFADDRRAMLMEAHFDAEFSKKEAFLAELNFCFGGVEYL
jgi:hypothetical protein